MAEKAIPIVEKLMHTNYDEILGLARRLKENFRRSQEFQNLVDKIVEDYVKDPQDTVLQNYKYRKFEREITVESSKLLAKSCVDLQLIFDEEVETHLKHPFLIKKMIAKDEALHESYQNKISHLIKDIENWKRSFNAETDEKVMLIKQIYCILKAELDKKAESERAKNDYKIRTYEDIENENKTLKLDLSKAQRDLKKFEKDFKASKDSEESYKQRVLKLSSDLKDLAAKYSELSIQHDQDLLK